MRNTSYKSGHFLYFSIFMTQYSVVSNAHMTQQYSRDPVTLTQLSNAHSSQQCSRVSVMHMRLRNSTHATQQYSAFVISQIIFTLELSAESQKTRILNFSFILKFLY